MPIVDTSWLVALFNEDDAHHDKAVMQAGEPGRYTVPHVILHEFLSIVRHRLDSATARRIYADIREDPAFDLKTECDLDHAGAMFTSRRTLSYADCVAASLAVTTNAPLLTFDDKQARAVRSKRH